MTSSKFITTPLSGSICESSSSPKCTHSQASSPNLSYQDSPSQLNSESPIYPELVGNTTSVDHILQQLTSSMWARGLNQLVKARNIHTIGDLSSLTEYDVHHLPIRSPKIQTVRQVLHEFASQLKQKLKKTNKNVHVLIEDICEKDIDEDFDSNSLSPDGMQPLPAVEEELEKLFPDKNDGECLDVTLEEVPEISESEDLIKNCDVPLNQVPEVSHPEDLVENLDIQSCPTSAVENIEMQSKDSCSGSMDSREDNINLSENTPEDESSMPSSEENLPRRSNSPDSTKNENAVLLHSFRELSSQFSSDRLAMLRKEQIDDLFQSLSTMTATCFQAMKAKCVSPPSQESQL